MSKINKVLYNVDQRDRSTGEINTSEEMWMARHNIGLDEVIGCPTVIVDGKEYTGIAPLGKNGLVPAEYLPSYVDAVIDGYAVSVSGVIKFYEDPAHTQEIAGEEGYTYVDITYPDVGIGYRWTEGSGFFQISSQNAFGALKAGNVTIHADQPMDLLTIAGDSGITVAVADTRNQEQNGSDKLTIGHSNSIVAGSIGEESPTTQINNTFNLPWASFDAQGHITATGSNAITIKNASTDQYGVTKLTSTPGTDETLAMTPKGVQTAIEALEYSDNVVEHQFVTEVDEVDGVISVTRAQPSTSDISGLSDALAAKQDTLTAGPNVTIDANNTISAPKCTLTEGPNVNIIGITDPSTKTTNYTVSATDTTYSAGSGLDLDGTEFSVDTTVVQPKLTAGTNINIDANNKISATDTTYSAGTGLLLNGTTFSVDTTAIQPKLTAGTNITINSSNKISATKSDWNASAGADGEILNKPVVIEGQIKLLVGGTKQFKNLTIDNSGFAGTPAAVSVTSTENTTYTPGYLVTPASSANKYLRSGTGGVPEWDILDMGTYEEYEDEQTSVPEDLTKIYVEKLYNGNERIKFNTESSYKYLVPPPSPNRQLVTNSGGVMQWDTINANISVREIAYRESNGTQAESTIYNDVSDDVDSGKTPMLWSAGDYGNKYFYIFKRRTGGSQHGTQQITYLFEGNDTFQNRIIRKLITDGTITTEVVPLQGRLTAGSGIAIDYNTNEIMCTGTGQVVDGIFKQVDSGSTQYTIQFGIGDRDNPFLDLVKTNTGASPYSTLSATHINEEEVQSHFIKVQAKGSNYIGKFWASQADTVPPQETPNASSSIRQLSTALHSVYDGTLSSIAPGSQEVPIDRVTLYGNTNHSYDENNLGNLTVGTLAMRIINASSTNPSHQLLASCVKGEIDLINVNKSESLYALTSDSTSSYIGVAADDCVLMVTTKPRKYTDAVARTKQAGDSGLGSIVMFPSKAYIDVQIENLNDIYLKKSFVGTAHVRLKTDTTYSNGNNTSIMSTTLTVAGNGTGTYDLQPIARKADRNGLISITITSLSPGKKCIMSVIGRASGESGYNTLLRFGGESDTALELYSYSATIPVIYNWSISGGLFNISINNKASSEVKYLIQVTAISGPCDYYP